jgi:hypothetical protein
MHCSSRNGATLSSKSAPMCESQEDQENQSNELLFRKNAREISIEQKLGAYFRYLFLSKQMCDITIVASGNPYKAQKVAIAARSNIFNSKYFDEAKTISELKLNCN